MDYQDATDFVETFKTHRTGLVACQLSRKQTEERNEKLALVKGLLWRGERYEEMWHKFNTEYRDLRLFPPGSTLGPETVALAMDKLFAEFFGASKPKTRKQKFNKIIQEVYNSYVYANEKVNEEREDIISMLAKLRDEEEDV